jgi:5-formyltetrahydrofolate cyclo-ligase
MEWTRVREGYTLKSGAFGIPVPEELEIDLPPGDALVIVPCVGFADNGHRIGHGAGYYDRFLAAHEGRKIGIAFEAQRVPDFEVEPHDVRMDVIVTEVASYRIGEVG